MKVLEFNSKENEDLKARAEKVEQMVKEVINQEIVGAIVYAVDKDGNAVIGVSCLGPSDISMVSLIMQQAALSMTTVSRSK